MWLAKGAVFSIGMPITPARASNKPMQRSGWIGAILTITPDTMTFRSLSVVHSSRPLMGVPFGRNFNLAWLMSKNRASLIYSHQPRKDNTPIAHCINS
jgi:hypothetical protein